PRTAPPVPQTPVLRGPAAWLRSREAVELPLRAVARGLVRRKHPGPYPGHRRAVRAPAQGAEGDEDCEEGADASHALSSDDGGGYSARTVISRYTRPELGRIGTDEARFEAMRRVEVAAAEELDGPTPEDLEAIGGATFTVEAIAERERIT